MEYPGHLFIMSVIVFFQLPHDLWRTFLAAQNQKGIPALCTGTLPEHLFPEHTHDKRKDAVDQSHGKNRHPGVVVFIMDCKQIGDQHESQKHSMPHRLCRLDLSAPL